jgi:hypothetical protein
MKLWNFNLQVLEKWEKYHCRSRRGIGVVHFFGSKQKTGKKYEKEKEERE